MILALLLACGPSRDVTIEAADHDIMALGAMATVTTNSGCRASVAFDGDGLARRFTPWSEPGSVHVIEVLGLRAQTEWTLTGWADCDGDGAYSSSVTYETGILPFVTPSLSLDVDDADAVQPGITFLAPVIQATQEPPVFLGLDEQGQVVWAWQDPAGDPNRSDPFLVGQADGTVMISQHDSVQGLTWGGQPLWQVKGSVTVGEALHHDATLHEDGSVLSLVAESRTVQVAGAATEVVGDRIVQLSQEGQLLWEWSAFDHLDFSDLSADEASDWIHANALLYRDGVLLLSSRSLDRLVAIDHATGEVLWQLGEGGDFELLGGQWFDGQHAPEWHDDGTLALFDNGLDRKTSSGVVYALDRVNWTLDELWRWETEAFTSRLGDANLMANGNLLVTAGGPDVRDAPAVVSEVTPDGQVVWELTVPGSAVYRALRIDPSWSRTEL
jgi:hypothetical protein